MRRSSDTLVNLLLLAVAASVPAGVAAYWLSSPVAPLAAPAQPSTTARVATGVHAPDASPARAGPLLEGVLYTSGAARVNWNGVSIPVENGAYAYLGGELIDTAPDSMGVLQLVGGGTVYLCPGTSASVRRATGGGVDIDLLHGISRFDFDPGVALRVRANRAMLTAAPASGEQSGRLVAEVVAHRDHPGGVVCGFGGTLDVVGLGAGGDPSPAARGTANPGEVVDVARALRREADASGATVLVRPTPMPADVRSRLQANAVLPGRAGFIGYLCRCDELKRYAEAEGIPDTARQPKHEPPAGEAPGARAPTALPPVAPPSAPSVALAVPGLPDPSDPRVLPAPTAGPAESGLVVPPPLVPASGTGGGSTSTPS